MKNFGGSMSRIGTMLVCALMFSAAAYAAPKTETLSITTYYPSPYGVYKMLQVAPSDMSSAVLPTTECDGDEDRGKIMFDQTGGSLMTCVLVDADDDPATDPVYSWQPLLAGTQLNPKVIEKSVLVYQGGKIIVNKNYKTGGIADAAVMDIGAHPLKKTETKNFPPLLRQTSCPAGYNAENVQSRTIGGKVLKTMDCRMPPKTETTFVVDAYDVLDNAGKPTGQKVQRMGIGTGTPQALLDIYGPSVSASSKTRAIMVNNRPIVMVKRYSKAATKTFTHTTGTNSTSITFTTGISSNEYYCTVSSFKSKYAQASSPTSDVGYSVWTYIVGGTSGTTVGGTWSVRIDVPQTTNKDIEPSFDLVCFNQELVAFDFGKGLTTDTSDSLRDSTL
jgi:hypothetical protein